MKLSLALPVLVLAMAPSAFAQQIGGGFNGNGGNNNGRNNQNGGGTLPLPKGVNRVISIDAYNILLAESQDENGGRTYTPIVVKHVYSGGMAALFGGISIPTAQFVSPGTMNGTGGNRNGNGNGNGNGGNRNGGGGFNNGGGLNGGGNNGSFPGGGITGGGFPGGGITGGGFPGGGITGGGQTFGTGNFGF